MPQAAFFLPIVFGIAHGLLFAVLLAVRAAHSRTWADLLLAGLIVSGCMRLLPYVLGFVDINVLWNEWMFLPLDTGLLLGPLFFVYLKSRTNSEFAFRSVDLIHAVPYLVFAAYRLAVFSQDADFVFEWVDRFDLPVIQPAFSILTSVSLAVYLFLSIRLLARYRRWLDSEFTEVESKNLGWLRSFLFAISAAVIASWAIGLLEWMGTDLDALQAWWPFAITTGTLYYLSIAGLMHPQAPRVVYRDEVVPPTPDLLEDLSRHRSDLSGFMRSETPYLDPDLSLNELSRRLGLPSALVSRVINEGFNMNFRSFVNSYRLNSVLEALPRSTNLTLVGVALDHGFNSKATFNRVFKQATGITPRQYVQMPPNEQALVPRSLPAGRDQTG